MQLVKQSEVPATSNFAGSRRSSGWLETRRAAIPEARLDGTATVQEARSDTGGWLRKVRHLSFVLDLTFDHDGLKS